MTRTVPHATRCALHGPWAICDVVPVAPLNCSPVGNRPTGCLKFARNALTPRRRRRLGQPKMPRVQGCFGQHRIEASVGCEKFLASPTLVPTNPGRPLRPRVRAFTPLERQAGSLGEGGLAQFAPYAGTDAESPSSWRSLDCSPTPLVAITGRGAGEIAFSSNDLRWVREACTGRGVRLQPVQRASVLGEVGESGVAGAERRPGSPRRREARIAPCTNSGLKAGRQHIARTTIRPSVSRRQRPEQRYTTD